MIVFSWAVHTDDQSLCRRQYQHSYMLAPYPAPSPSKIFSRVQLAEAKRTEQHCSSVGILPVYKKGSLAVRELQQACPRCNPLLKAMRLRTTPMHGCAIRLTVYTGDLTQVKGIQRGNQLGPGITQASLPELGPGGSWCTCMNGCHTEPPSDVAHVQVRARAPKTSPNVRSFVVFFVFVSCFPALIFVSHGHAGAGRLLVCC